MARSVDRLDNSAFISIYIIAEQSSVSSVELLPILVVSRRPATSERALKSDSCSADPALCPMSRERLIVKQTNIPWPPQLLRDSCV